MDDDQQDDAWNHQSELEHQRWLEENQSQQEDNENGIARR